MLSKYIEYRIKYNEKPNSPPVIPTSLLYWTAKAQ